MKKNLKQWTVLILALLSLYGAVLPAYAITTVDINSPRLNTDIEGKCIPNISSSGLLTVTNVYDVSDSSVTQVIVTTYIEKRTLLVIWNRVDIGTTNDEWVDYGGSGHFVKTHTAQMPSNGTYRVTVTFDVYSGSTLLDSKSVTCKLEY